MKKGLTWMFRGDFNEPLQARSWRDRFSSQANPESVEKSDIRILVATIYANPFFSLSLRDSVRAQLDEADAFVREHPGWVIARDAEGARQAISRGKRVMILALEGASGILETEEGLSEFCDRRGIRIVTLLHFVDDQFGGPAFLKGLQGFANPLAFLKSLVFPRWGEGNVRVNPRGLTETGTGFVTALARHHVWVDLSHSSDQTQKALVPELLRLRQPLLYTHTVLRKYFGAERAITDEQLKLVKESGGYLGLMPSEDMLAGTPVSGPCPGSVQALAVQYREIASVLGSDAVAFGTDYNGGLRHLRPSCGTGTSLDQEGFWNIGQASEVWQSLRVVGAPVPADLNATADRFLQAWGRVSR
ncbi:MAG: membrane dipeptidase [Bdellovibrionota bacterium]